MFPVVSFFALNTHLEPIIFAPGGASSSLQVPAAFKVTNSSSMACSHSGQSGRRFALASVCGSSASVLAVSAVKTCSRPLKSSSSSGVPLITAHTPPASSPSLANDSGNCMPGTRCESVPHMDVMPSPDCKSHTMCEGFRKHADRRNCGDVLMGRLSCGGAGLYGMADMAGVEGVLGELGCSSFTVGIPLSSPLSCADVPK